MELIAGHFQSQGQKLSSVGFIFRISEATLMVFSGISRTGPTSVQLKILNSLRGFSHGPNQLLAQDGGE